MKKRLLLASLLLLKPVFAGDLGPADLAPTQMSSGFPSVGQQWKAWCGSWKERVDCTIQLGNDELIVNETHKISYSQIVKSEKWDSMMAITRLARPDPLWTGWNNLGANHISALANTVLIEYKSSSGSLQSALVTFPENRISDWYGFGNAMRLISYGARPAQLTPAQPAAAAVAAPRQGNLAQ